MRRFLISGNWKMNCGPVDAADLLEALKTTKPQISEDVDVLVCPPFVSLGMSVTYLHDTEIQVGAQNIHFDDQGAYTGEISASMLTEAGCNFVLIGHSERREYFGETDSSVNKKAKKAMEYNLVPVICVGESLDQRKQDIHFDLVKNQVITAFEKIDSNEALDAVIAYEPIWAIGSGKTPAINEVAEMHSAIRGVLKQLIDEKSAQGIRIIYGGSLKANNAKSLMVLGDVDGGLIGGASLTSMEFIAIAESCP